MAIPETDVHRIQLWCRERVPEHPWPQVKVEADVETRHVTIVEVRPPWDGVASTPVSRSPVFATPRRPESGRSTLRDRNLNFHEYDRKLPSKNVQALLDYIAESGDSIFWG